MPDNNTPPGKKNVLSLALQDHVAHSLRQSKGSEAPSHVQHALEHHLSPEDKALCMQIAQRGVEMAASVGVEVDLQLAAMDVAVVHVVSCPLRLWQFLASAPDDFSHDFTGIGRFIDRPTGMLREGFRPRFAAKKQ